MVTTMVNVLINAQNPHMPQMIIIVDYVFADSSHIFIVINFQINANVNKKMKKHLEEIVNFIQKLKSRIKF